MTMITLLGIETSCDDTSLCLIRGEAGLWQRPPEILSFESYAQDRELRPFGGVVPELAARNHLRKLTELLPDIFSQAKLDIKQIDGIAVTIMPGLLGPLLTGVTLAKTLALWREIPIIGIHHLQAHLEAIHLETPISYPYLGLLASGGHSAYYLVQGPEDFTLLGTTTDDAAGEAFDKGGKLMGLGYPAGRTIDERATKANTQSFSFPVGLKTDPSPNLSFSGVKTALRTLIEKHPAILSDENKLNDLCSSYQKAIVDALMLKLHRACEKAGGNLPIVVGGGVACNSELRRRLLQEFSAQTSVHIVPPRFCTDNAAMIAGLGLRLWDKAKSFPDCLRLEPQSQVITRGQGV